MRLVLLVQRVGDREDELLLARVVLVPEPVDARRGDDRQEGVGDVDAGQRRLKPRDVALERGAVVGDRPRAEPDLSPSVAPPVRSVGRPTRSTTSRANAASCSA